jgi:hypothetical protein
VVSGADELDGGWRRAAVAEDVELACLERGAGETVLLVPGWTMSAEVFEHQN